jgi:hypothetical protein
VRQKRRIKVWGVDDDTGKYIRCWRCGFIVDTTKSLGNPDRNGIVLLDFPVPYTDAPGMEGYDNASYSQATLDFFGGLGVIGTAVEEGVTDYYTPRESIAAQGCPMCGLTNF